MLFSIEQLQEIFPCHTGIGAKNIGIEKVMMDSRKKTPNSLFIPIIGERFDAHEFIDQAIEHGAIATLWDQRYTVPEKLKNKCLFFYTDDTLTAFQKLANLYRQKVNPIVIGITGSNGKTTTKDILSSILRRKYRTHQTAGNYNNDIGLPLTILSMPNHTEVLVLEMGMNDFGEIDLLTRIALPDYAIITNIGESHIEYLGSREGIAKAKLEVINGLKASGSLIVDGDEPLLRSLDLQQPIFRCGFSDENETFTRITKDKVALGLTTFTLGNRTYQIPLTGRHHAKNAAFAIVVAKELQMNKTQIQEGLRQIEQSDMRFETIETTSGALLINDAYNASPTSMIGAIEIMKQLKQYEHKVVVLGDIFELGKRSAELHKQVGKAISEPITAVYTIGKDAENINKVVQQHRSYISAEHFTDEKALVKQIETHLTNDTIILFKASRGMAFEKIIQTLIDQTS